MSKFSDVRNMRRERKTINKIVRIFLEVESLIEIQERKGNRKREYTSFCKAKIIIIRTAIWRSRNH